MDDPTEVFLTDHQLKILEGVASAQGHNDAHSALDFLIEQAGQTLDINAEASHSRSVADHELRHRPI